MKPDDFRVGFRVVGSLTEPRLATNWQAAFLAHCANDPKSDPGRECYLSAFQFRVEMRNYLAAEQFPKKVCRAAPSGWTCRADWVWIDIDRKGNLPTAVTDVKKLTSYTLVELAPEWEEDSVFIAFSGGKGFHVGIPLTWNPPASANFPEVCKHFAEGVAARAGVSVDSSIYESVRCFRAPNSRHPKSGLYKRPLDYSEVMEWTADRIAEVAAEPRAVEISRTSSVPIRLREIWGEAVILAADEQRRRDGIRSTTGAQLSWQTENFLARVDVPQGERAERLFQAAGNLREFGASVELITQLLFPAAKDTKLPPKEIHRQIRCGIENTDRKLSLS